MCTGMELAAIAGTAASTAGAGINAMQSNRAITEQNAQNRRTMEMQKAARNEEVQRQLAMEELQAAEVAQALFGIDPAQTTQKVSEAVASPQNEITQLSNHNAAPTSAPVQNKDVQEASQPGQEKAAAQLAQVLGGASTLNEQNKAFGSIGDIITRARSNIANIGSNRSGSSRVAGLETGIPTAEVTPSNNPLGDILLAGGSLAAGFGGKGIGAAGGELFPSIGDIFKRKQPVANLGGLY